MPPHPQTLSPPAHPPPQIAYQGPPGEAKAHFESLGFHCPPAMDLADFVVAVTGKAGSRKLVARRGELAEVRGDTNTVMMLD